MITVHVAGELRPDGGTPCTRCGRLLSTMTTPGDIGSWGLGTYVERDEGLDGVVKLRALRVAPGEQLPMLCAPMPDLG